MFYVPFIVFLSKTLYSHIASFHTGVKMGTGEFTAAVNPAMDWHPIQGGVEILLVALCYGNRDNLRSDGPLGSYADLCRLPTISSI